MLYILLKVLSHANAKKNQKKTNKKNNNKKTKRLKGFRLRTFIVHFQVVLWQLRGYGHQRQHNMKGHRS